MSDEDDRRPDGRRNVDGEFKRAYFGRLVRFTRCPSSTITISHPLTGRGGHGSGAHQEVRREETGVLWQHEHGSGDIVADGQPDSGELSLLARDTYGSTVRVHGYTRPHLENSCMTRSLEPGAWPMCVLCCTASTTRAYDPTIMIRRPHISEHSCTGLTSTADKCAEKVCT